MMMRGLVLVMLCCTGAAMAAEPATTEPATTEPSMAAEPATTGPATPSPREAAAPAAVTTATEVASSVGEARRARARVVGVGGAIVGATLGLSTAGLVLFSTDPVTGQGLFQATASDVAIAATGTVALVGFTGLGALSGWLFTVALGAVDPGPWLAVPVGLGAGIVIGAVACGLGFASVMTTGVASGAVSSGIDNVAAVFGLGAVTGALMGSVGSAVIGAIAGPVTSLALAGDDA